MVSCCLWSFRWQRCQWWLVVSGRIILKLELYIVVLFSLTVQEMLEKNVAWHLVQILLVILSACLCLLQKDGKNIHTVVIRDLPR